MASGEQESNVCYRLYSDAVLEVGQEEVWRAFDWLYHYHHRHEPQLYVGDCLRNTPGSMKHFQTEQKAILNSREDPANMDIPLLYRLLQHTCGLAPETASFTWNNPQSEAERQCLEHQLYRVKKVRNAVCHKETAVMHMTYAELNSRLKELNKLLCYIVREAGKRSAQPAAEVEAAVANIEESISDIQVSIFQKKYGLPTQKEIDEPRESSIMIATLFILCSFALWGLFYMFLPESQPFHYEEGNEFVEFEIDKLCKMIELKHF